MTADGTAFAQVEACAGAVEARCGLPPTVALVLGSGLGGFGERLAGAVEIDVRGLPHWPSPSVPGHAGRLMVGGLAGRRVAVLDGRTHLYEGHGAASIVLPVRVMGRLGVRQVILTNAAGALSRRLAPGSLMVIDDHINLTGSNPLAGPNDERFGPRFVDMTDVYAPRLRVLARDAARAAGVSVRGGVYLAMPGPSYETPAEVRFLRTIGADAVGMSTVHEAIAARHMGLEVLGLSCITNLAAGMSARPVSHDDVLATTREARPAVMALLEAIVSRI